MTNSVAQRLIDITRQELARMLQELCTAAGAAESSILLPRGTNDLIFFASSNPVLLAPGAPVVPISASFAGLALQTGQTIAFADAAGQEAHNKTVDQHVGVQTHEYAAIPIYDHSVVGVLTLVNRPKAAARRPFDIAEMQHANALAQDLARPIALLASLAGGEAETGDDALDPGLTASLVALNEPERRIVHTLAESLLQNRGE